MCVCLVRSLSAIALSLCTFVLAAGAYAGRVPQRPAATPAASSPYPSSPDPTTGLNSTEMAYLSTNAEIYVKGPKGAPIDRAAVVTLLRTGGQFFAQSTTKNGLAKFDRVPTSDFTVQVVAPGYQTASKQIEVSGPGAVTVTVVLQPLE